MYGPLGFVFNLPFGNVTDQFDKNPTEMWIAARALAAVLCTAGVAATYWAARRLWGVREGLVAAALLAFAFLPVAYSRIAVTDVGALLGVSLALGFAVWAYEDGRVALLRGGRRRRRPRRCRSSTRRAWRSLPLAIAAIRARCGPTRSARSAASHSARRWPGLVFVVLNPYLFGSLDAWWSDLRDQAEVAADQPKPGQESGGLSYYLDSLTWGLGWAAAIAALFGAALELRRSLVRGLMLVAVPLALFVYLSAQSRYFGRWLLPAYPALAMLGALALTRIVRADRGPRADAPRARAPLPRAHRRRGARRPDRARAGAAARRGHPQRAGARPRRHPPAGARLDRDALPARAAPRRRARRARALVPLEPGGRPAELAQPLRATRRLDRAGLVVRGRPRQAHLRAVQAGPRGAPGRWRAGVLLPLRARARGDRRLPPLRLLPRHDGGRGARPRPSDGRPARRAPTTSAWRTSRAWCASSAHTTRAPTPCRSTSTSPTTTTRPSTTGLGPTVRVYRLDDCEQASGPPVIRIPQAREPAPVF